ncbi:hypothetical protein [Spirosoma telluris]|uniref:hypothetical protein n=1 Tax=Spirosoma telluris TaxID=2183553 RepID=UPI002FC3293B
MKAFLIKTGLLTLSLLTLFSCNDVLEEYNPSGLTAETVYTTPEGFETLVNAAYTYQRWWYGKEEAHNIVETGTDIWTSGSGETDRGLTQYLNLQGSDAYLTTEWREFYAAINLCNGGIKRIDKAGLSATLRPIRKGNSGFCALSITGILLKPGAGFTSQLRRPMALSQRPIAHRLKHFTI